MAANALAASCGVDSEARQSSLSRSSSSRSRLPQASRCSSGRTYAGSGCTSLSQSERRAMETERFAR